MIRSICIITATLLSISNPAFAHVRLRAGHEDRQSWRGEVIPYLGVVDLGGVTEDMLGLEGSTGGILGVEFQFLTTRYLEAGFNIADIPVSTNLTRNNPYALNPELDSFVGADILLTDFNLSYNLSPPGDRMVPYLQAGVGRESIFYDGVFDRGFTTYTLGGGIKGRLHRRVSLTTSFHHTRTFVLGGDLNLSRIVFGLSILF
jgi:hypothetical protein